MIGKSIENYQVTEKLQSAETYDVYKAVDILLDREVYIKVLKQEFMNRTEIVNDFRLQAETLTKLSHSCVPTLYYLTMAGGRLFIIMEFLDGETLDKILYRERFSSEKAVWIFSQVLDCLEYAHNAGIRHGDLKTADIILDETETPKILGFGKSAPLQNSEFSVDHASAFKSDIVAVGKMLYESLTGEIFVENQIEETKRRLYSLDPAVPQAVTSAITKVLFRNSVDNFQTATEFKKALTTTESDASVNLKSVKSTAAAAQSGNFAAGEGKFKEKIFIKNSPAPVKNLKSVIRRKKRDFALAGAAICAIIVLHLAFQFSFIQSENFKVIEELSKNEQIEEAELQAEPIDEDIIEPEVYDVPEVEKNDFDEEAEAEAEKVDTVIDYKPKKTERETKQKTVSPRVPIKSKPAPRPSIKKKEQPETRAERLRRAEKILTGV